MSYQLLIYQLICCDCFWFVTNGWKKNNIIKIWWCYLYSWVLISSNVLLAFSLSGKSGKEDPQIDLTIITRKIF